MVVLVGLADFPFRCAFRKNNSRARRAAWLQRHCRRALDIFPLKPRAAGPVPSRGLLISNHLGYLDILVLSAITPAVFVSKREVKFWPVFGQFAQMAGTLFVNRERRTQVGHVNDEIQNALDDGALVVLFPEGKSSNGADVLPFKSALLEPAARRTGAAVRRLHPIRAGRRRCGRGCLLLGRRHIFSAHAKPAGQALSARVGALCAGHIAAGGPQDTGAGAARGNLEAENRNKQFKQLFVFWIGWAEQPRLARSLGTVRRSAGRSAPPRKNLSNRRPPPIEGRDADPISSELNLSYSIIHLCAHFAHATPPKQYLQISSNIFPARVS